MSNSFLGHPDQRSIFGRERPSHIDPNQLCPIPDIDFAAAPIVRFAARSLFPMPKGSLLSHSSRHTADRQATQRRRISRLRPIIRFILFVIFARKFRTDLCRERRTPVTGLSQKMIKNRCGRSYAASSISALHPLSTCASFTAKSSKMSATGHYACLLREKGAACHCVR
jgi:hypothetical protein